VTATWHLRARHRTRSVHQRAVSEGCAVGRLLAPVTERVFPVWRRCLYEMTCSWFKGREDGRH
jgi:hypothetical protein